MKWSIFSLSQIPDQARRVASFDADLRLFELAEDLGYDKIWIAEHLFSTYGVVTSTQVYAAAIAQRTRRVRVGTAAVVVPFNHPLRTASDFALIDILSHGRLDFGVGRAYQLHKHGAAIADDPETCVEKLRELKRRFGLTEFTLWFNVGGIDPAHCERAMRLAMERVIPYV